MGQALTISLPSISRSIKWLALSFLLENESHRTHITKLPGLILDSSNPGQVRAHFPRDPTCKTLLAALENTVRTPE